MSKFVVNSFNVPNAVIDEIMPILSDAALRCYLVVTRQTTGWQKTSDHISISQFMTKTGKSRNTVIKGCNELEQLGLIVKITDESKSSEYTLNLSKICTSSKSEPVQNVNGGSSKSEQEVVQNLTKGSSKSEHTKDTIQKTIKNTKQKTSVREKNLALHTLEKLVTDKKLLNDFLIVRKAKKAPLTETAVKNLKSQADKADLSLDEVLEICIARNWIGFNASWNWQNNSFVNSRCPNKNQPVSENTNAEGISKKHDCDPMPELTAEELAELDTPLPWELEEMERAKQEGYGYAS